MTTLNDTVRKKALYQLLGLLVHQFPKVKHVYNKNFLEMKFKIMICIANIDSKKYSGSIIFDTYWIY